MNPTPCAYSEYAPTGLGWVDHLPAHWGEGRLRWLSRIFSGGTPDKSKLEYWSAGTIPWLASGEVNQKRIIAPTTYITEDAYKNSSAKWVRAGALVMAIAGQGKTKGTVARLGIDATCNQSLAAIDPYGIDPSYLFYWLDSNYRNIRGLASDELRDGLNLDMISDIGCPIPSEEEQSAIANFLDRETARIDTLIDKQEQLIKLLEERMEALISSLIFGAPLSAPARLAHHIELLAGFAFPSDDFSVSNTGLRLLRGANVGVGEVRWDDTVYWNQTEAGNLRRFSLRHGDIVFGMDRPWISSGARVAVVGDRDLPSMLVQRVARIRSRGSLDGGYLRRLLSSREFRAYVEADLTGVSVPHISADQILGFSFPMMPSKDQRAAVARLDEEDEAICNAIKSSERAIALMCERRSALISAAVTGKIDVRTVVQPKDRLS